MDEFIEKTGARVSKQSIFLFCFYIFLSFFETYLTPFFGNGTKFYLLMVLALFMYSARFRLKINSFWMFYLAWFFFKFVSIAWSSMSNNDFKTHLLSQIGMVLFVIVMVGGDQSRELIHAILQTNLWISFLFGVLSIFFRGSFISEEFVARQVLTLFGQQNDPNNCAAFLLVGITLGLYSATIERKKLMVNGLIVAINIYALLLTSSRAGFLTLGAIIVCIVFLPQPNQELELKKAIQKILLIVLIIVIAVALVQRFLPQTNIDRLLNWNEYESGSGRDIRWERAIQLFMQRPLFGWGWGGYNTGVGAIHNTFLTSLCDIGVIGTLLFVIPIFMVAIEALRQRNVLSFLILVTGVLPAFVLDAINKRFFWNAIVFSIMIILYNRDNSEKISIW